MSEEQIDYLDALMEVLVKSPHLPSGLRTKVKVLQDARRSDKKSNDVTIPIKVREITEKDLELYDDSEEE